MGMSSAIGSPRRVAQRRSSTWSSELKALCLRPGALSAPRSSMLLAVGGTGFAALAIDHHSYLMCPALQVSGCMGRRLANFLSLYVHCGLDARRSVCAACSIQV